MTVNFGSNNDISWPTGSLLKSEVILAVDYLEESVTEASTALVCGCQWGGLAMPPPSLLLAGRHCTSVKLLLNPVACCMVLLLFPIVSKAIQ